MFWSQQYWIILQACHLFLKHIFVILKWIFNILWQCRDNCSGVWNPLRDPNDLLRLRETVCKVSIKSNFSVFLNPALQTAGIKSEGAMWGSVWWESGNRERKMHLAKLENLIKTMLITLSNDGNLRAEGGFRIKGDIKGLELFWFSLLC